MKSSENNYLNRHFLIAMQSLADPNFDGTLVYVAEHNEKGAFGLVVNRKADMDVQTLFERIDLEVPEVHTGRASVLMGGPVQAERGFVLHRPLGAWSSTLKIDEDLGLTSSRDILEATSKGDGPQQMVVLLGYAGWGPGQLERELSQNAWLTVQADAQLIFDVPVEQRVGRAYELLGIDPLMLSTSVGHA